jgi:hypothetical protein
MGGTIWFRPCTTQQACDPEESENAGVICGAGMT